MRRAACCLLRVVAASVLLASSLAAQPRGACTPVAAHALGRGQTLTADDIGVAAGGSPLCTLRSTLVGSVTRRVIAAGEVLRSPAVVPPALIAPNDPVAVIYRDGGLELRLQGVAANAAPIGGRVTVRVAGSPRAGLASRTVDGVAVAPGVVQVK
jgi:flagella basal body P-ring formation protein FlgA